MSEKQFKNAEPIIPYRFTFSNHQLTSMKAANKTLFIPILLTLIIGIVVHPKIAISQPNVDIGLFDAGNNTLEVRLRPDADFDELASAILFTIRWDSASGAHLGNVNQALPELFYLPTAKSGAEVDENGYRYQVFVGLGFFQIGEVPGFPGFTWQAGQEIVLMTIPVEDGSGEFSIINDAWTGDILNNGDFFVSLNGLERTDSIYTDSVDLCLDLSLDTTITDVSCLGGQDGAIDLLASGATPPYSFNWSNSATTEDISNLFPDTYDVAVTDTFSCVAFLSANVTTLTDNQIPTIDCPGDTAINTDPGLCDAFFTYTSPIGNDNCPGTSTQQTSGLGSNSSFPLGFTTEVFSVSDSTGNTATCSFTINVIDNESPQISCQPDTTIGVDSTGCFRLVNYQSVLSSDNCSVPVLSRTQGLASGSFFPLGTTTINYQSTDSVGNVSTCSFEINVVDDIPPIALCQDITVQLDANGTASITHSEIEASSSDSCGILSLTASQTSFDCADVGAFPVTLTVTDNNLNEAECTANVTVLDSISPTVSCPADTAVFSTIGHCSGATFNFPSATADDNCGIESLIQNSGMSSGSVFPFGSSIVTFLATDSSGNTGECAFLIDILANPVLNDSCPDALPVFLNIPIFGSTDCANPESLGLCGTTDGSGGAVWYKIMGNGNEFTASSCGAGSHGFDTKVRVFKDGCTNLTCVDGNDNNPNCGIDPISGSNIQSEVKWCTEQGVEYLILVHGAGAVEGLFSLLVTERILAAADAGSDDTLCLGESAQLQASAGVAYNWTPVEGLSATDISNPQASPGTTTTYHVEITDSSGCLTQDSLVIIVNITTVIAIDDTICYGDSVILQASPSDGNFDWAPLVQIIVNSNIVSVSPLTTTAYAAVDQNTGCSDDVTVVVTGTALLEVQLDAQTLNCANFDSLCCTDRGEVISAVSGGSPPFSYLWSNGSILANLNSIPEGNYSLTVTDTFGCVAGGNVTLEFAPLQLNVKAFLGGPYDNTLSLMSDRLREDAFTPLTEPYSAIGLPIEFYPGGDFVNPAVFADFGPNSIVDWILVHLRDKDAPQNIVATKVALLQRDGDIVALDGLSPLSFDCLDPELFYISIQHRNHLHVMTANAVAMGIAPVLVDFTDPLTPTFGVDAQDVVSGTNVLWPGNCIPDNLVKYVGINNDRDPILVRIGGAIPTAIAGGYLMEDVNMDGIAKYMGIFNDRDIQLVVIGGVIPTAVRLEQLP